MKSNSRTKNSIINSIAGMASYVFVMIITMVSRIVFARYFGKELLGLNSLFASVIQILQLSELGIGNAIIISLYKPVKEQDYTKIRELISLYKKIYDWLMIFLAVTGVILTIFLVPNIVKTKTLDTFSVQIYFLLFMGGVISSYAWAYSKSILYADQRNRVATSAYAFQKVLVGILQILIIILYRNYLVYLILVIFGNLLENLICHKIVLSDYEFLREKTKVRIENEEKKKLLDLIKPIIVIKIADKVLSQSDSLIINAYIDLITVGMYSNYQMIHTACQGLFTPIGASLTSSYGNLSVDATPERKYEAFIKSYTIIHSICIFFCLAFMGCIQDFIYLCYGHSFVLSNAFAMIMTIYLYFILVHTIYYSYQNAMGLQKLDLVQTILQVPFNIVVSILLFKVWGLDGILIGTVLSIAIFSFLFKGRYIYQVAFNKKAIDYFKQSGMDLLKSMLAIFVIYELTVHFRTYSVIWFIVKVFIIMILSAVIILILFSIDKNYLNSYKFMLKKVMPKHL